MEINELNFHKENTDFSGVFFLLWSNISTDDTFFL